MKCRACGYVSLEERELCPRCGESPGSGAPAPAGAASPPSRPEAKRRPAGRAAPGSRRGRSGVQGGGAPALEGLRLEPEPAARRPSRPVVPEQLMLPSTGPVLPPAPRGGEDPASLAEFADDENLPDLDADPPPSPEEGEGGADFTIEDDLIPPSLPAPPGERPAGREGGGAPGPLRFSLEEPGEATPPLEPIIDRDDEVPEHFWAAEGAGLGRRAGACAVDGLVLLVLLGLFASGGWAALRLAGLAPEELLRVPVLRAVVLPFALLALLLSLGYSVFFHAWTGSTPGKRLAGLEVVRLADRDLSAARSVLRWCAALLAVAAVGAGVLWALFEPRRRGWADLLSGTVVTRRRTLRAGGG